MRKISLVTYLSIIITALVIGSAVTASGIIYFGLSQSLTKEFEDRVQAEGARNFLELDRELSRFLHQLQTLSLDNAVRVTLLLGAYQQLQECLTNVYGRTRCEKFFVVESGERGRIFATDQPAFDEDRVRALLRPDHPVGAIHADEDGRFTVAYTLPIKRQMETLGTAVGVYYFDNRPPGERNPASLGGGRLLVGDGAQVRDMISGQTVVLSSSTGLYSEEHPFRRVTLDGIPGIALSSRVFPNLQYFETLDGLKRVKTDLFITVLPLALALLICAAAISWCLSRSLGRPLLQLSRWAQETSARNHRADTVHQSSGIKEIEQLACSLNLMLADLKQAEELSRYQVLFDGVSDAVFITDFSGFFIEANAVTTTQLGYTDAELFEMNLRDLFAESQRDAAPRSLCEIVANDGRGVFEADLLAKDGRLIPSEIHARKIIFLEQPVILSVVRDVTERKRVETQLRDSEEKYRTTFQGAPDAILIFEQGSGRILEVNEAVCQSTNYTKDELIGSRLWDLDLLGDPDDHYRLVSQLRKYEFIEADELQVRAKSGTLMDVLLSAKPIRYAGRDCVVTTVRDMTALKNAKRERADLQAQLLHAQKMQAVGTLAGGVAHDFNNLLQAISGSVQLMLNEDKAPHSRQRYLKDIDRAANRAADLIRRLLAFSRKVDTKLNPIDLNHEINLAVAMLKRTIPKMIEIETDLAVNLKGVRADANQLEQLIVNLATNARDAMPEGGRLTIRTRNVVLTEPETGRDGAIPPGEYVLLAVIDTGTGMDEETLRCIFDPFFTTKEVGRGTGLGLSTVYGTVKTHGGYIGCRTQPGQGTEFRIFLPIGLPQSPLPPSVRPRSAPVISKGHETILLVDDESSILDIGQEALTSFGYGVRTADNGESALAMYQSHMHEIDLVIMDLGMPGMGGLKCLQMIKALNPEAKIIVASGYAPDVYMPALAGSACVDYLPKPYKIPELMTKVRMLLEGQPSSLGAGA